MNGEKMMNTMSDEVGRYNNVDNSDNIKPYEGDIVSVRE